MSEDSSKTEILAVKYANYIQMTGATLEATAKAHNVTMGHIIHCLYTVLPKANEPMYKRIRTILAYGRISAIAKMHEANTIKGLKKQKQLENLIIDNLVNNNSFSISRKEIEETLRVKRNSARKYLNRVIEDENNGIILQHVDKFKGIYTFVIGDGKDAKTRNY